MKPRTLTPVLAGILLALFGATAMGCASNTDAEPGTASLDAPPAAATGAEDPRVEHRLARMTEHLELSEEQVGLVRPILERMEAQRAELESLSPEERFEAHRAAREQLRADLEGVLTPEQLAELDSMPGRGFGPGHHRGHRGPRGDGFGRGAREGHGPPSPEQMIEHMRADLSLTDAQVEALRPIFENVRARHEALRDMEPDARRAAARALHEEVKAEVDAVLTAEQRATLEARFREGPPRFGGGRGHGPRGRGLGPPDESAAGPVPSPEGAGEAR